MVKKSNHSKIDRLSSWETFGNDDGDDNDDDDTIYL